MNFSPVLAVHPLCWNIVTNQSVSKIQVCDEDQYSCWADTWNWILRAHGDRLSDDWNGGLRFCGGYGRWDLTNTDKSSFLWHESIDDWSSPGLQTFQRFLTV